MQKYNKDLRTCSKGGELNASLLSSEQEVEQKTKLDKEVLKFIPTAPGKSNSVVNTQQKLHQTTSISQSVTEFYLPLYNKQ